MQALTMKSINRAVVAMLALSVLLSAGALILSAIALNRASQPQQTSLTPGEVQFLVEQTIHSHFSDLTPQADLPFDSPALEITNREAEADLLHDKDVAHRFASLSPWDQRGVNALLTKFRQDASQLSNRELLAVRPYVSKVEQDGIDNFLVERTRRALGKP